MRPPLPPRVLVLPSLVASLGLPALSCGEPDEGFSHVILLSEIQLVLGYEENGSLRGLNMDDRVDDVQQTALCSKVDGTAPDGTPGIDNQFAVLGAAIVSQLGGDASALVQSSINDGRLLILFELEGLHDMQNDDDVSARVHFGVGPVNIGTDGFPEPGQSFDLREDDPAIELHHLRLVDGRIDIRPFDITIKVDVLQANFELTLLGSRLVLDLAEDGSATGTLGAGVDADMVLDIVANDETLMPTYPAVSLLIGRLTDLEPDEDGDCQRISVGMEIGGEPAFILE